MLLYRLAGRRTEKRAVVTAVAATETVGVCRRGARRRFSDRKLPAARFGMNRVLDTIAIQTSPLAWGSCVR